MVVLLKTVQVILVLSALILIHELGHFFFAKIFGIRVDKFYLFFDVGGKRLFSTKNNKLIAKYLPRLHNAATDYGIGWLPLGGYCKIRGMVDESLDTEQLKGAPEPDEFRTHPAWQRLLVMFGGVLFNFIFAIVLFTALLANNGHTYIKNEGNAIYADQLAMKMGFKTGDMILRYDDYVPKNFLMLQPDLARRSPRTALVLRDNDTVCLYVDHSLLGDILNDMGMFSLAVPFVVDSIPPISANYGCGLVRGDRIVKMEGHPIRFTQDSRALMQNYKNSEISAVALRGTDSVRLSLKVDSLGLVGIIPIIPGVVCEEYNFWEAIPEGFKMTFSNIDGYLRDLKMVFTPSTEAYKSVGSFIAIGQAMPSVWDWTIFFNMMAMLSLMLGVMNLIPIPGLDGGHIMITLYEMISGRKPSEKFLVATQMIGMVLIIMLMVLAMGNDITRLIR